MHAHRNGSRVNEREIEGERFAQSGAVVSGNRVRKDDIDADFKSVKLSSI